VFEATKTCVSLSHVSPVSAVYSENTVLKFMVLELLFLKSISQAAYKMHILYNLKLKVDNINLNWKKSPWKCQQLNLGFEK
jgi:hypothetical protein